MKVAHRENLAVVKKWEESRTAKMPGLRPKWDELIQLVEKGSIDALLCWHINRLVRNMEEGGKLVQLFVEGKIKQIRTPHASYSTGDNILPLVIEAAAATQYSIDLSHTIKRAMDSNFRSGNCNHRAPQGYRNARSPVNLKRGVIEVDPERFHVIREAWDLMLTGVHSVCEVVEHLNTVHRYTTRITKKGGGKPLSKSAGYGMFRNPFYMGYVRYKNVVVSGRHRAMVSSDEFARVQELLDKGSFSVPHSIEHAFTGIMRCVRCGYQVTAERKLLRNGTLWTNYHCCDPKGTCSKRGIDGEEVELCIERELSSVRIDPQFAPIALEVIQMALEGRWHLDTKSLEEIEVKLLQSDTRLKNLEEMGLNGLIRGDRYRELENAELEQRQSFLTERERLRTEQSRMQANAERAIQFIQFAPAEFRKSDPARQKEIARALAVEYRFDGVEKWISVTVLPLLREIVKFVQDTVEGIGPPISGSGIQKEPAFASSIRFGGPQRLGIEVPEPLLRELKGPLFPEFAWEEA